MSQWSLEPRHGHADLRGVPVLFDEHHQIGEVADGVGLSRRTIRCYQQIGLFTSSDRTEGGFVVTEFDIDRLHLVGARQALGELTVSPSGGER